MAKVFGTFLITLTFGLSDLSSGDGGWRLDNLAAVVILALIMAAVVGSWAASKAPPQSPGASSPEPDPVPQGSPQISMNLYMRLVREYQMQPLEFESIRSLPAALEDRREALRAYAELQSRRLPEQSRLELGLPPSLSRFEAIHQLEAAE